MARDSYAMGLYEGRYSTRGVTFPSGWKQMWSTNQL